MKLPRGPAWHLPPQGTGRGDTPGSGESPRRSSGAAGGKTLTVGCSPPPPAQSLGPCHGRKGRAGASGLAGDAAASEPALGLSEAARGGAGREGEVAGARGDPSPGRGLCALSRRRAGSRGGQTAYLPAQLRGPTWRCAPGPPERRDFGRLRTWGASP